MVGVFEASTSVLKEWYAHADTNVFQLSKPRTFADPLTEVLRNAAPALLEQAVEAEVQARLHQRNAPAGGPAP